MTDPQSILDQVQNQTGTILSEALAAFDKLADYSQSIWYDFPNITSVDLAEIPPLVDVSDLPALEKVEIDLSMVSDFDPGLYKQATYISSFFTFLEPQLIDFIENGGPGISQSVQDAIFQQTRERDLQALNDSLDVARVNYGRRGFPMPTSMMRAQENELIKTYQNNLNTSNRDITALIANRAQDTMKAAVNSGIRMEDVQAQFSLGYAKLLIDVSNQLINQYRMIQDANLAEFRGQIESILAQVQVSESNATIELKKNDQLMELWKTQLTTSTDRTRVSIAEADGENDRRLEALKSTAQTYAATLTAIYNQVNAFTSVTEDTTSS